MTALTKKQIEVLLNIVREERQFWDYESTSSEEYEEAKHHGRTKADFTALERGLRKLMKGAN